MAEGHGAARIEIGGRFVGDSHPIYLVAEMSANHHGDLNRALRCLEAAKEAGADAVKVQTYRPDTITIDSTSEPFVIRGTIWEGRTLFDLYREASMPWEWQPGLQKRAVELGLDFFSTPFDEEAVDFLEGLEVPVYKIASFESVDLPLLRKVAGTGKPIILSTGMATREEIAESVSTIREAGGAQVALLKCTSAYPAPPGEVNLRTIPDLRRTFGLPVGLSDHTTGTAIPVAAAALGVCIIEKHFTLSRKDGGPDSPFSLEPGEFRAMADEVRTVERAMGSVHYGVSEHEKESVRLRRSLFVVRDMEAGEVFSEENVRSIRPGCGLHTRHLKDVLGRRSGRDIPRGTPFSWELVAD